VTHTLVVRMDRVGDVLLSGPLVRAVAAGVDRVSYLASPKGAAAALLLPGVDEVIVDRAGWIEDDAPAITRAGVDALLAQVALRSPDEAVILTSFHQSPLPMALLLRLAGVRRIGAISVDYPGSLLDVRHLVDDDLHEVRRALSLGQAMGYTLPAGDDARLRVRLDQGARPESCPSSPFIVVHPGASVRARAWDAGRHAEVVELLARRGWTVVVTGGPGERSLTAQVAGAYGMDLGGRLSLPALAALIGQAEAIVVANTGPAHLAAAVGTPVVSLYAPTVPALRWRPWMVPNVLLGDQTIACAGCRARICPVAGHPCLSGIRAVDVVEAVERLTSGPLQARGEHMPAPARFGSERAEVWA
jgi:ADP-heptose:LPS heptosyltransferase